MSFRNTEAAFEDIYHKYKNLVYNLALNYTQNKTEAEDITQEVFIKIYQKITSYNPETASLKTWLYRIAINQCIDFCRAKNTQKRFGAIIGFLKKDDEVMQLPHYDHPGIAAEHKEQLQKLLSHINELPEKQKAVIMLLKMEDCSQKEAAAILNISVKAIESLLQRAKQTLEKKLRGSEGF